MTFVLAIFGSLSWMNMHSLLRAMMDQGSSCMMIHFTNPQVLGSAVEKSRHRGIASLDIERVVADVVESFSADDGIASDDRMDFVVSFQTDNGESSSSSPCQCDIVTTDCLDVIACMPGIHDPEREKALAWTGIELRSSMKRTSEISGLIGNEDNTPLGKALQYNTMDTWKAWRITNILPAGYDPTANSIFVHEAWYRDCLIYNSKAKGMESRFIGHSCFYTGLVGPEDSAGTIFEDKAHRWYEASVGDVENTRTRVNTLLDNFFRAHQPSSNQDHQPSHFSSLGNLLLFAHTTRMLFNRRSFLDQIYQQKLTSRTLPRFESGSVVRGGTATKNKNEGSPFNVALHIRRGDSCGKHEDEVKGSGASNYESVASPLDSHAQIGSMRMCYKTEVYLDAVKRIRALVPKGRPLHVYLATDDVGDIVDEITKKQTRINDYGIDVLHYLDYSRKHFQYESLSIEDDENAEKQPKLGETAVADLWLLSHGHAFVGHKGSRFGKISWLLAMARRNNFVPFSSVDGHSFCCEIDESCGAMKPFVTVENCLTFGHEYINHEHENYWENGSTARKTYFQETHSEERSEDSEERR